MRVRTMQNNTSAYYVLLIITSAVGGNIWTIYGIINESVSVNTAGESRETGVLSTMSCVNKWCSSFILTTTFTSFAIFSWGCIISVTFYKNGNYIIYKTDRLSISCAKYCIILTKISHIPLSFYISEKSKEIIRKKIKYNKSWRIYYFIQALYTGFWYPRIKNYTKMLNIFRQSNCII